MRALFAALATLVFALVVTLLSGCGGEEDKRPFLRLAPTRPPADRSSAATAPIAAGNFPVPPPPISTDMWPCMENCHKESEPDPMPRELSQHDNIVLEHGYRPGWCYDCHNPTDRDQLRLASGQLVPFAESYRLCGQCHGDKYRDWRVGVHGRRTGSWSGQKQYVLCIHCHNPHSPRFKPLAPLPPPRRPGQVTGAPLPTPVPPSPLGNPVPPKESK